MQSGLTFFPLDLMRMFYNIEIKYCNTIRFENLNQNLKDWTSFYKVLTKKEQGKFFFDFWLALSYPWT